MKPGDDVTVEFSGVEHFGEVLKVEQSGFVLCRVHTDPLLDYGRASARVSPEQVIAVRSTRVKPR